MLSLRFLGPGGGSQTPLGVHNLCWLGDGLVPLFFMGVLETINGPGRAEATLGARGFQLRRVWVSNVEDTSLVFLKEEARVREVLAGVGRGSCGSLGTWCGIHEPRLRAAGLGRH